MPRKCPCGKYASFNTPGKNPICCSKCKTPEMIHVMIKKRCPCGNHQIYNVHGGKPICCSKCKTSEMIDVKNKRCLCGNHPIYNVPGENIGICCKVCKTDEMIDVKNKKCPCGNRSIYNMSGETLGICCVKCKTPGMIDVMSKKCPGYNQECPVRTCLTSGHKYCMSCDPNDARRKRYKRYEEAFFDYVKDKLDVHQREFIVKFDPIDTAKKYARLDGVVLGNGVIVCLEVDENGHQEYECDEHRMHLVTAELLQRYPEHTVSWVRVNPSVDVKSQWSKTSKAIREKRFEDVVLIVKDILATCDTRVVYIGFDYTCI